MSSGLKALSLWVGVGLIVCMLAIAAIAYGAVPLTARSVIDAIGGRGDPITIAIVRMLRLPRALLALLVGGGLGMAGAALQGALRNALAEPYLLGVSGGAAVGAVAAVSLGASGPFILPLASFAGAALAIAVALLVARAGGGRSDPRVLLMAGVIVGAFANAAIMVLLSNSPPNAVRNALWWMMGSVADASWLTIGWLTVYVGAGGALLLWFAREIDILSLGEESAAALGVDAARSSRNIFLIAALLSAATVAAAGLIGFVGLVVPHLVRSMGVRRHRALIAGSALVGAGLVVAADLVARLARPPAELPLGAVTALLGVPFFLVQLRRLS
ncbi:MAG TPA: iron ABC transporter permease [Gemmatimonadaceae bacterium]|nr:iron ABC transporter permease [Gemmatimonadaceae bacterium]